MAYSQNQTSSLSSERQGTSCKASRSCDDKISNLPDVIIHHILSFLPTKEAVATSVLSKRWVSYWTSVPTLDLEDTDKCRSDEQAKMTFVHFVYRVLQLSKACFFQKFRLNCDQSYGQFCIKTWICSAVRPGLQEVDISISLIAKGDLVKLPGSLFLVKTLKILKLRYGIMVDVPDPVCLPSLEILHLRYVYYANDESLNRLISGCSSLEELHVDACICKNNMVNCNISTPTLSSLSLNIEYDSGLKDRSCKVEINAPALRYLNLTSLDFIIDKWIVVENLSCLIEAHICIILFGGTKLFRALNNIKSLKLSWVPSFNNLTPDSFPLFESLTQLELYVRESWDLLSLFLQNSYRLETLVIHDMILTTNARENSWTQPKNVPICLLSSLTIVCFKKFGGLENEMKVVEYFLKKARVLRTMKICSSKLSSHLKLWFSTKLSMFPRCSDTCQLSLS